MSRTARRRFAIVLTAICLTGVVLYALSHKPILKTTPADKFCCTFPDASQTVLENCDRMILYSIYPRPGFDPNGSPIKGAFHDYPILGQTEIGVTKRKALLAELYNGLAVPEPF